MIDVLCRHLSLEPGMRFGHGGIAGNPIAYHVKGLPEGYRIQVAHAPAADERKPPCKIRVLREPKNLKPLSFTGQFASPQAALEEIKKNCRQW